MDQALNQKIDAFIAANKEQILQDIADLVAINSVEGTPEEGAPYGKGPKAALEKTLEMAREQGSGAIDEARALSAALTDCMNWLDNGVLTEWDRICNVKLYSKQTEYSDEVESQLRDAFWDDPALSPERTAAALKI